MERKAFGLLAMAALSGCIQPPPATKVTNLSASPVQVTYVAKKDWVPQTISLAAGEAGSLGDIRLSDFASVQFRSMDDSAIFRDTDADWRDSDCVHDCEFIWYDDGRVAITA